MKNILIIILLCSVISGVLLGITGLEIFKWLFLILSVPLAFYFILSISYVWLYRPIKYLYKKLFKK